MIHVDLFQKCLCDKIILIKFFNCRSNTSSPVGGSGASGGVNSPVDEAEREKLKEKQRQEREKVYLHIIN